jgi:hypothetical protein
MTLTLPLEQWQVVCFLFLKFTFAFNFIILVEADAQHKNVLSTFSNDKMDTAEDEGLKKNSFVSIKFIRIKLKLI